MKIDTDGTYTLQYTAEDSCGNETIEERTVEAISYSTVLFTDGTFIINEKSTDRDANVALHGAATNVYDPLDPNGSTDADKYIFINPNNAAWRSQRKNIKSVEMGSSIAPLSTAYWFTNLSNCTSMNLSLLDTSNTTSMEQMFSGCRILPSLDVTHFNTSNVTDMSNMFYYCETLTSLDVTHFNTSKVTDMSLMFGYCRALTSLDVTHFDTSNVGSMAKMFYECRALTSLDVTHFNTSNVTNMGGMFEDCEKLTSLDVTHFNTSNVTNMGSMFYNCDVLSSLDVTHFNTSNVTNMSNMFSICRGLTTLDLSNFDTSNVTNMEGMFYRIDNVTTLYASPSFVVSQVTKSIRMFYLYEGVLKGGAGTKWSSSKPDDKTYAHIDGGTSNPGYFTAKS